MSPVLRAAEEQRALEARAAARRSRVAQGELTQEDARGVIDEWLLRIADHTLLLDPTAGQWLYLDTVHDAFEPAGVAEGEGVFVVVDGELGVERPRPATATGPPPPPPAPAAPAARPRSRWPRLALLPLVLGLLTSGVGLLRVLDSDDGGDGVGAPVVAVTTATADEPARTSTTEEPATTAPVESSRARCTSAGYSLEYPAAWFTDAYEGSSPCHLFHPEPFDALEAEGGSAVAITVDGIGTAYADWIESYDSPDIEILDRHDGRAAGRASVRFLYRFAGDDTEYLEHIVDRDGEAFVIRVDGDIAPDMEEAVEAADVMAATLTFT